MIPLSLFAPHVGEEKQIQERIAKAAPPEQHEIPLHDHLKIPPTTVDRFLQIMALRVGTEARSCRMLFLSADYNSSRVGVGCPSFFCFFSTTEFKFRQGL